MSARSDPANDGSCSLNCPADRHAVSCVKRAAVAGASRAVTNPQLTCGLVQRAIADREVLV